MNEHQEQFRKWGILDNEELTLDIILNVASEPVQALTSQGDARNRTHLDSSAAKLSGRLKPEGKTTATSSMTASVSNRGS